MKMSRISCLLLVCALVMLVCACAKQPAPTEPVAPETKEQFTIKTMVTGIDQFDGGAVWGLNTGHGTFVVGPEVPGGIKSMVYEHLMEAHDQVITIRYADMPATGATVAHKRVTAIVIEETEYRLDY
ncbi:hypothetical protein OAN24_00295 [Pseudodesulfovibrio sp.]|nr:hypothetical protein [Pseudodesulfovibrio sp.]